MSGATFDNKEFCSELPPLTTQNEILYNVCLTSSMTLLQSIQAINLVVNNEQCENLAFPFFCNVTHVLCGNASSFVVGIEEKCVQIRDYDCAVEWRVLENIFGIGLPDCMSFAKDGNLSFSKAPALACPDEFNVYCGSICLPSCKEFYQISSNAITAANVATITSICLGLLGGVFTLIMSILNRRKM